MTTWQLLLIGFGYGFLGGMLFVACRIRRWGWKRADE